MKTYELISYSRRRIKGNRRRILLICLLPLGAELFFRTAETALYSILLYFGEMPPTALFTGENSEHLAIAAIFAALRLFICPPLWCAAAVRMKEFTDEKGKKTSFSDMLLNGRFIRRSISAAFWTKMVSAAASIPSILLAGFAVQLVSKGADSRGLIIASNAAALSAAFAFFWLTVRASLTAVPFLLAEFPKKGGFSAVMSSLKFMRGRRKMPLLLAAAYILPMLTIVAIPFLIPELAAAFSIGISIYLKEDEYVLGEQEEFQSGRVGFYRKFGRKSHPAKLSPRKMRRIAQAAAKAEKP